MVLLSASICTKSGKALVGRNFMEVSRSRIEGLLAAFPKLIKAGGQHTFVETDNVRYVYQPMDNLYMVLITTKNSNILEDLETLRLFARVVPEYCEEMTEHEVTDRAFELIFAFDEIVALGYREKVTMAQIRTFTEMDSHDENIYKMVKKNKEAEQREVAKRRAKELTMEKRQRDRLGISSSSGSGGGMGHGSGGMGSGGYGSGGGGGGGGFGSSNPAPISLPTSSSSSSSSSKPKRGGMKLGAKGKKDSDFVEKLMAEGQAVEAVDDGGASQASQPSTLSKGKRTSANAEPEVPHDSVHVKVEEKVVMEASRDGGLETLDVKGIIFAVVSDPQYAKIKINTSVTGGRKMAFQTHPNVDKKVFNTSNVIQLKSNRPFPDSTEVGVVKWRYQSTEEADIPITINCWPTINNDGSADINIDYELQHTDLVLEDVCITVPVPGAPTVNTIDGDYNYERRDGVLEWTLPTIDESNAEGSIEFSVKDGSSANQFFPVTVSFRSKKTFAGIEILGVEQTEGGAEVPFSSEVCLSPDSYEYV